MDLEKRRNEHVEPVINRIIMPFKKNQMYIGIARLPDQCLVVTAYLFIPLDYISTNFQIISNFLFVLFQNHPRD